MKKNLFSRHDNRHTLQTCGQYFGQGLGKRLEKDPLRRQHHSENHTSWGSKVKYASTYRHGYASDPSRPVHRRSSSVPETSNSLCYSTLRADKSLLDKFHTLTKPNFRRFPNIHSLPSNLSTARPEDLISTALWYNTCTPRDTGVIQSRSDSKETAVGIDSSPMSQKQEGIMYTTPLSVLAATQQPFLKHSPWRYSYKQ